MQRLVKRVVGWVIWACLATWATVFLWAVTGGSAFDFGRVSDVVWVLTAVVLLGAVARMTIMVWLVVTDRSADEPTYRL